jgi:predicted glycoside hydrolase/deacetylase ChbG (UPF0249 family)
LAIFAALALTGLAMTRARAESWAERLGYPAGSKVLILHAGELGLCHESNAAAIKLLESGALKSASAMAPAPWFGNLAKWAKSKEDVDVGLELTLNSEMEDYRWSPVAGAAEVPSLVGPDGFLWQLPVQTTSNADADDVETELWSQVSRAKTAGLEPSHLTTHLGTLFSRPDLIETYLRVARQEWIPTAIVELTPEIIDRMDVEGFALPDDVIDLVDEYPLPKIDDFRFVPSADTYEAKKQAFLKMLQELPAGITQIEFRPALASDALSEITDDAQQRVWDAELLADEEVLAVLKADGVMLTDWREIMQRFEGRRASTEVLKTPPNTLNEGLTK